MSMPGRRVRVAVVFGGRSTRARDLLRLRRAACWPRSTRTGTTWCRSASRRKGAWVLTADDPEALRDRRPRAARGRRDRHGGGAARRPDRAAAWSCSSPARAGRGARRRRRGLPGAARPVRRGRHDPGPAGAGRRALRRAPGVLASAAAMDKEFTKKLLAAEGLPVGPYAVLRPRRATLTAAGPRPARAAGVRQAGPRRLVDRDHPGRRLGRRWTPRSRRPARHDPKVLVEAAVVGPGDRVRGAGGPGRRAAGRQRAGRDPVVGRRRTSSTTSRPSTSTTSASFDIPADAADERDRAAAGAGGRGRSRALDCAGPGPGRLLRRRRTASSPSTRSTRCRASRRSRCSRGCGRRPASTTRTLLRPADPAPRCAGAPACAESAHQSAGVSSGRRLSAAGGHRRRTAAAAPVALRVRGRGRSPRRTPGGRRRPRPWSRRAARRSQLTPLICCSVRGRGERRPGRAPRSAAPPAGSPQAGHVRRGRVDRPGRQVAEVGRQRGDQLLAGPLLRGRQRRRRRGATDGSAAAAAGALGPGRPARRRSRRAARPRRPRRAAAVSGTATSVASRAAGRRSRAPARAAASRSPRRRAAQGQRWTTGQVRVRVMPATRLDLGDDQLAQLVDVVGLGADDHVVRTGDVLGLGDPGDLGDLRRPRRRPCRPRSGSGCRPGPRRALPSAGCGGQVGTSTPASRRERSHRDAMAVPSLSRERRASSA